MKIKNKKLSLERAYDIIKKPITKCSKAAEIEER